MKWSALLLVTVTASPTNTPVTAEPVVANAGMPALALMGSTQAVPKRKRQADARYTGLPLRPFTIQWTPVDSPRADASALLHAPAGQLGFVTARDGHFFFENGERFRLWGVNVRVPAKEDAPDLAKRLAQLGINCVRLHYNDCTRQRGDDTLIDNTKDHTQDLNETFLDRLDFFVHCLKENGVYTWLQIQGGRSYKPGDGVRDCDLLTYSSGVYLFDERCIELQRALGRKILQHGNRYTGTAYKDEPAVAVVEVINENTITGLWQTGGQLDGQATQANTTIDKTMLWGDLPVYYGRRLDGMYQESLSASLAPDDLRILKDKLGVPRETPVPRLRASELKNASPQRLALEAAFYTGIERRYFDGFRTFLRDEIGVRCPVVATSDHYANRSGYLLLDALRDYDVIDRHYYYHPDLAMVDNPHGSMPVSVARGKVDGKGLVVSEINCDSYRYKCEPIPLMAAYAAFHDWDGIIWFTASAATKPRDYEMPPSPYIYDISHNPVMLSQLLVGAHMFLGGLLRPAERTVSRNYTQEDIVRSVLSVDSPFRLPGFPPLVALKHGTAATFLNGVAPSDFHEYTALKRPSPPIVSDTGELEWSFRYGEQGAGVLAIDTERVQGLIGFCKAPAWRATQNLRVSLANEFAAVVLCPMDGRPITRSRRLLLSACAQVGRANNGTAIEPVTGTVELLGLGHRQGVAVYPLDGAGKALEAIPAVADRQVWRFQIGQPAVPWYVLELPSFPVGETATHGTTTTDPG